MTKTFGQTLREEFKERGIYFCSNVCNVPANNNKQRPFKHISNKN